MLFFWTLDVAVRSVPRYRCYTTSDSEFTVGNDVRKAIVDGYPIENVVASDLKQGKANHRMS
jgi:hypothetical protein